MGSTIVSILAFIFALGLIILIHEGGHFFFARRVNVLCREYAFGMGPRLISKKKGETTYSIRALPIGGFCAIAGEEEEADPLKDLDEVRLEIVDGVVKKFYIDPKNKMFNDFPKFKNIDHDIYDEAQTGSLWIKVIPEGSEEEQTLPVDPKAMFVLRNDEIQIAPYNRRLASKRKRDRAMIMFGGPLMNFVLALVVFFIAGLIGGFVNTKSSVISEISTSSPASATGLMAGDEVKYFTIDDVATQITSWDDISSFMDTYSTTTTYKNNAIIVSVIRDGQATSVTLTPELTAYSLAGLPFCMRNNQVVFDSNSYEVEEVEQSFEESYYEAFGSDAMPLKSVILKANDVDITCLQDLYLILMENDDGTPIVFECADGKSYTFKPYTQKLLKAQLSLSGESIPLAKISIGICPTYKFNFFQSFAYAGKRTLQSCRVIIDTLALLFSGKIGVKSLGGIVSIFSYTKNAASEGFATLLNWIGLLSVNIGIMNLLPIPALDGGRLVFLGYEAITKKKPSPKVETILITVTMILLLLLMAYVTFNDIMRLF